MLALLLHGRGQHSRLVDVSKATCVVQVGIHAHLVVPLAVPIIGLVSLLEGVSGLVLKSLNHEALSPGHGRSVS